MLEKYVSRIYPACGEETDFVIILNYDVREEAINKILEKCQIQRTIASVLTTCRYKDKEISVSKTGKVIIKEARGRENAEKIMRELLK